MCMQFVLLDAHGLPLVAHKPGHEEGYPQHPVDEHSHPDTYYTEAPATQQDAEAFLAEVKRMGGSTSSSTVVGEYR